MLLGIETSKTLNEALLGHSGGVLYFYRKSYKPVREGREPDLPPWPPLCLEIGVVRSTVYPQSVRSDTESAVFPY